MATLTRSQTEDDAGADTAVAEGFVLLDGRGRIVSASEGFSAVLGHTVHPGQLSGRSLEGLLQDVLCRPDTVEASLWLHEVRAGAGSGHLYESSGLRLRAPRHAGFVLVLTAQCAPGARTFLRVRREPVGGARTASPVPRVSAPLPAPDPSATLPAHESEPTTEPTHPLPGLGSVLEALPDAVFVTDTGGRLLIANEATRDFFSRPVRNLAGQRAGDLAPRELATVLAEADAVVVETGQVMRFSRSRNVALGHWREYEIIKAPLRNPDGLIIGIVTTARDITIQGSQIRHGLEQARLLDAILTHIPYFVFWKDHDLVYQGCSQNFADIFGAGSRNGVIGATDKDLLPLGAEAETFHRSDLAVMTTGTPLLDVHRIVHRPDGRPMHWVISTVVLRDNDGATTGVLSVARDVTAARRMEAERDRLSRIMQSVLQLPVIIFQTDDSGIITEWLGADLNGEHDAKGKDVFRLLPGAAGPLRESLTQRRTVRFDVADDRQGWALDMVFGPDRPGGRGYLGVGLDVTERRRAERALKERDRLLSSIIGTIPVIISAVDRDGIIFFSEGRGLALVGGQPGEVVGRRAADVWSARPEVVKALETAMGGRDVVIDVEIGHAALQMHFLPMADDEDDDLPRPPDRRRPALILGVDISERRHAEAMLQRSEDAFRSAFTYASHGMAVATPDGTLVRANPMMAHITGRESWALADRHLSELCEPADADALRAHLADIAEGERAGGSIEVRFRHSDGALRWVQISGAVMRDASGAPGQIILHVQDVTDRRRAEARFRAMFEKATIGLALLDERGVIVTANAALCRILDAPAEALAGRAAADLLPVPEPGTWRSWREVVGGREAGAPPPPWLRIGRHAFSAGMAEDAASILMVEDSSEVRELEDQLAHLSKLTALGEMAASLAHEINQPLNTVRLVVEAALEEIGRSRSPVARRLEKAFSTVHDQTQRIAEIIRHVRQFGRRDGDRPRPFDPVAVTRTVVKLFRHEARKAKVTLDVSLPRTGPLILGHTVRFEQVLINLLSNAVDAASAHHGDAGTGRVSLSVTLEEATRTVVIAVADNGPGIPDGVRDRVFEPFFTTKPADQGSGLGLAICLTIVAEMNGRIDLMKPAEGARIEVRLPVPEAPEPAALPLARPVVAAGTSAGEHRRGGNKGKPLAGFQVLVVDDEPEALEVVARSLRGHGIKVLTAHGGHEAFERFLRHEPDAVITDLTMPEGGGEELIERIAAEVPGHPIIVMTGRPVRQRDQNWRRHVAAVLGKPVGLQELRATLKDLLLAER